MKTDLDLAFSAVPCPWCEEADAKDLDVDDMVRVVCSCGVSGPWGDDIDEALENWSNFAAMMRDLRLEPGKN